MIRKLIEIIFLLKIAFNVVNGIAFSGCGCYTKLINYNKNQYVIDITGTILRQAC